MDDSKDFPTSVNLRITFCFSRFFPDFSSSFVLHPYFSCTSLNLWLRDPVCIHPRGSGGGSGNDSEMPPYSTDNPYITVGYRNLPKRLSDKTPTVSWNPTPSANFLGDPIVTMEKFCVGEQPIEVKLWEPAERQGDGGMGALVFPIPRRLFPSRHLSRVYRLKHREYGSVHWRRRRSISDPIMAACVSANQMGLMGNPSPSLNV